MVLLKHNYFFWLALALGLGCFFSGQALEQDMLITSANVLFIAFGGSLLMACWSKIPFRKTVLIVAVWSCATFTSVSSIELRYAVVAIPLIALSVILKYTIKSTN